jgi:hypothetical protein
MIILCPVTGFNCGNSGCTLTHCTIQPQPVKSDSVEVSDWKESAKESVYSMLNEFSNQSFGGRSNIIC